MRDKQQYIYFLSGSERMSQTTIKGYVRDIETFEKWLKDNKLCKLEKVTLDEIDNYKGYCTLTLKNTATTVNKKLAGIRKYYDFCIAKKGLSHNPVNGAKRQKIKKKEPNFLTEKEVSKLLRAIKKDSRRGIKTIAKVRDYAMFKILVAGGLRVSELCNIKAEHIDFNKQLLRVIGGKGDKDREVPLGESTLESIKEYLAIRDDFSPQVDNVFVTNNGVAFDRHSMNKKVKSYCKLAGLDEKRIHPHTLRHTCATLVYAGSGDVRSVQTMLGHSSAEMVSHYVHIVERQVRQAALTNKFA